jgi:thiamine kinase-like enzyme
VTTPTYPDAEGPPPAAGSPAGALPADALPADVVARLDAVPLFRSRPRVVTPLPGGLTNQNYRVDVAGRAYVARLSSPTGALLAIDRAAEHANSVAAAAVGVAPAVVGYVPAAGVLVVEWVAGRTFTGQDVADGAHLARIAATCRRLHAGPRFGSDFDMFTLQRYYLGVVRGRGFRLPPRYLDFMPVVDRIRSALAVRPLPTVPCHNDLLAANIIDDGDRLWFIDYEYSGNNDPCFELGNIASEAELPLEQLEALVTAYFGCPSRSLIARARLLGLMSQYGWTLWASIQDAVSTLGVDFWSWGMARYERAVADFDGPDLARLLQEVGADP